MARRMIRATHIVAYQDGARRGIAMESFARYLARGVNMTLATDTCPQSMIEALRWTAVVAKIVDRRTEIAAAAEVFNAARRSAAPRR